MRRRKRPDFQRFRQRQKAGFWRFTGGNRGGPKLVRWFADDQRINGEDLKPFRNDEDASLLALFDEKNNCDVEMYTEPKLSMVEKAYMEGLIENQKGHESVEGSAEDSEPSEDSMDGIHFEDSEEQKMHEFDEDLDEGLRIGWIKVKNTCLARMIVENLKNNNNMKLNEVVVDVRLRFANETIGCRAFKDSKIRFERCYMCFDGIKKALKLEYTSFIGLNGHHLNTKYGGILLNVVGRDAMISIFLLLLRLWRMKPTILGIGL
ncbi:unnamed protein product [Vicia faba]|uniref:Uncharacterized protein n=1 Tax=Vicia faba TaxID=3906 RepID=A0AAV1BAC4_VICFA|nr:unnamed protein product [Vicia faba]